MWGINLKGSSKRSANIEWNHISDGVPDELRDINNTFLLLVKVYYRHEESHESEIIIGAWSKDGLDIDEPILFEYPVNYFEGKYEIHGWICIKNR